MSERYNTNGEPLKNKRDLNDTEKEYLSYIRSEFEKRYQTGTTKDGRTFYIFNGLAFAICFFDESAFGYPAFCLEYVEDMNLAENNIFQDDGDWFYFDEMTKEQMLTAMVAEIEDAEI